MQRNPFGDSQNTVVVAGGAGFIGSHLCDALLAAGSRVICVDSFVSGRRENVAAHLGHPAFRLVEHDVREPLTLDAKADAIYNLAAVASPRLYQADPIHTLLTGVVGTANLLELAERHGARFVQASTSEVYGDPAEHPQREQYWGNVNCTGPRACYDEGKRAGETLCFDYLRAGRLDARVARIFNTYGPRMREDDGRIVANLIAQGLRGEPMTIYGDGEQTRSFCYVSDLVAGLVALMQVPANPQGPVNLGNPEEVTVKALADLVARRLGVTVPPRAVPLPEDDPRRRQPDISRARALLGWSPVVSLGQGLDATIADFRARRTGAPAAATA